jgi:formate hydrogenlyase transcriptional activator
MHPDNPAVPDERFGVVDRVEHPVFDGALKLTFRPECDAICSTVLELLETTFAATSSWILLLDRKSNCLVSAASRGEAQPFANVQIPADKGIVGLAFSTAEPVFVPDVLAETRWFDAPAVQASGLPSIFTVPLIFGKQRVGVLGFHSSRFGPEALPSNADRALVSGIGVLATLALTNARLSEDLNTERSARARMSNQRRALMSEISHLRAEVREGGVFGNVVGDSPRVRELVEQAQIVAPTDTTVLLLGETGTGKELIARAIHDGGPRARNIFVAVNCAALPATLVESELFGHEKGAFTGAIERKAGKFELADGGTIFLDEIGDLPLEAQAKILRVLQENEITRVGGTRILRVSTRVIAATNQDLLARVQQGLFRSDLYYRLSVFPIELPPLRDRRDDIPALVAHFVARSARRLHTPVPAIEADAMERLTSYDWPGNIRELQNVVERAVLLARGGSIRANLIVTPVVPDSIKATTAQPVPPAAEPDAPAAPVVTAFADAEKSAIVRALHAAGWRISGHGGAAEMLGLRPTTLHAKMKKLGVRRPGTASTASRQAS